MSFWLGLIVGVIIGQSILCIYGCLMLEGSTVIAPGDDDDRNL